MVNIAGLTLAMAVFMLIALYVKDDLFFDRFHKNGKNIYRLVSDVSDTNNEVRKTGNTGHIQGPIFKREVPEINAYCRIKNGWNSLVKKDNEVLVQKMIYADSSFLSFFTFDVIEGNPLSALDGPNKIVITDEMALKYFGKKNVVGSVMSIGDEGASFEPYIVSAVIKKLKSNSSIQFDLCASFDKLLKSDSQYEGPSSWLNSSLNTFVSLRPDAQVTLVNSKLQSVTNKYLAQEYLESKKVDPQSNPYTMHFHLQPLFDMHLDPDYFATNGLEYWSNEKYPKMMATFAIILLIIASINFINLALARSLLRTKEIGIRKTIGGTRIQLFFQFLVEAFLVTIASTLPAILLAHTLLPSFSDLTDKYFDPGILYSTSSLLLIGATSTIIALLSGGYPAFVMSGFLPIKSIKGQLSMGSNQKFKQGLVVFQFSIALFLMTSMAFINQQFNYINDKPLGYETSDRLRFWLPWDKIKKISKDFKQELSQLSFIKKVSGKSGDFNKTKYNINGKETEWIYYEHIDENHLQLMGIPLKSGRYFSYQYNADTVSNIIVNESFVAKYLSDNDPLTSVLKLRGSNTNIIGVVKDFHYSNFREKIEPMVFYLDKNSQTGCIHVHFEDGKLSETVASIQALYKKYEPYLPLEYQTLDDFRMEAYRQEIREKRIVNYTAFLAIMIACLGLFGLATFTTEQRVKEISIRKVMGAGVINVLQLLTSDFIKLVIVSFIIAIPITYYFIQKWLQSFAYRIDIDFWVFIIVFFIATILTVLTVSYQSIKTALVNPAKTLRSE